MKFTNFFVIYIPNELEEKFNIPSTRVDFEHTEARKKGFLWQAVGSIALKLHISYDQSHSSYTIYWCIIE